MFKDKIKDREWNLAQQISPIEGTSKHGRFANDFYTPTKTKEQEIAEYQAKLEIKVTPKTTETNINKKAAPLLGNQKGSLKSSAHRSKANVAQNNPKSNTQNAKTQIAANNPPANNNTSGSKSLSYEGSVKEKGKGTYEVYNEDILQKYMPPEPKLPFHTEEARLESERARRKVAERRMLAEQKRTSLEAERAKREQSTIQKDEEAKQNVQKQSETKASETPAKAKAYESRKVTEFDNHMRSVLGIDKYHNNRAMRAVEMEFKEKIKNGEISPEDRKKELRSSVLDFFVKTFKKK